MSIKRGYEPIEVTIPLSGGGTLIIQQNYDPEYRNEIFIGLGDEDGVWKQDIAAVGQCYQYKKDGTVKWLHDRYIVRVWGNPDVDEITEQTIILERKEEE